MRRFIIGKLVGPEIRTVEMKREVRSVFSFAILVGRASVPFDVWDDDDNYDKYLDMPEGMKVCASVGDGIDTRGRIKYYLNDMVPCPDEFEQSVQALFSPSVKKKG